MKKRTSNVSRRVVSLLMSMVLTLTLVTPAAFATEVVGGSGTTIVEGNANPADANPNEDTEGKDDENKDTEHGGDEQPTNPGDEDKNPGEGEDDVNASSNEADTQEGEGTDTPVVAQRTVTVEQYRTNEAYEVKIVVGVEEDGTTEKLDTTYTIGADTKTVTLKLTTADYAGKPIYIKTALDDVLVTEGENQTPALTEDTSTLEYTLPDEGDVTLYYGTQADFVSAWYTSVTDNKYTIRTAEELANFAQLVNDGNDFAGGVVTLARDIDLSAVCHPADEEKGIAEASWTPIGTFLNGDGAAFSGKFDGNKKTVNHLFIHSDGIICVGLFEVVSGGMVENLSVSGAITVQGASYLGGIVALLMGGTITNCNSEVSIELNKSPTTAQVAAGGVVGEIVGDNDVGESTVSYCSNSGDIVATAPVSTCIGGVVGALGDYSDPDQAAMSKCKIENCKNSGTIAVSACKDDTWAGGIVGIGTGGSLRNCCNRGKIALNVDSLSSKVKVNCLLIVLSSSIFFYSATVIGVDGAIVTVISTTSFTPPPTGNAES